MPHHWQVLFQWRNGCRQLSWTGSTKHSHLRGILLMLKNFKWISITDTPFASAVLVNFALYRKSHLIAKNTSHQTHHYPSSLALQCQPSRFNKLVYQWPSSYQINCALVRHHLQLSFKACKTVAVGSSSFFRAPLNNLLEFHLKAVQTCLITSSEAKKHKHLFFMNLSCHCNMDFVSGASSKFYAKSQIEQVSNCPWLHCF